MALDDQLLEKFCAGFFGYGNLAAPIWFLGMEEGGGNSEDEISRRLHAWISAGEPMIADIVAYCEAAAVTEHLRWFTGDRPPLQKTWTPLMRVSLAAQGVEGPDNDGIRRYQRDEFARSDGAECLLELLPLPSPGTDQWYYSEWSGLAWLASRDAYREQLIRSRLEALAALIDEHQPGAVVAYSRNYRDHWSTLVDGQFRAVGLRSHEANVEVGQRRETRIYVCHHPTSFLKKRNEYFAELGILVGAVGAPAS